MEKNIAVIWGDCSSPEIVKQTLRVLDKVAEKYGHTFHYTDAAMGGEAIDKYGDPLPQHELDKCLAADSVLLGAVGGPKWEGLPGEQRPEKGLLRLRAGMGLYSNNRPAKIWPQLAPASPLKPEIVAKGIDFIIVRELIGGVYFGKHETYTLENGEKQAVDSMPYSEHEIERIGRIGFETAMKRRKKLCCVDKANVLDTSRLWRSVMHRLQAEYPDVEAEYRTYSRNWMKSEDGNGFVKVDRQDILDLIEGYVMPRGTVKNVSIQDSTVIVTMSGMSLTQISDMFDRLKEQPIVADARLTTALTPELDNTENLDFSFIITVQKAEEDGQ